MLPTTRSNYGTAAAASTWTAAMRGKLPTSLMPILLHMLLPCSSSSSLCHSATRHLPFVEQLLDRDTHPDASSTSSRAPPQGIRNWLLSLSFLQLFPIITDKLLLTGCLISQIELFVANSRQITDGWVPCRLTSLIGTLISNASNSLLLVSALQLNCTRLCGRNHKLTATLSSSSSSGALLLMHRRMCSESGHSVERERWEVLRQRRMRRHSWMQTS